MSSSFLEIIGPSGSGKSSFYRKILREHKEFVGAYDFFLGGRNLKVSDKLKSLLVDFKAAIYVLVYLAKPGFSRLLAKGFLWSFAADFSLFHKINFFRNFSKKLVLFYFCKQNSSKNYEWIVLDEGLLQMAHSFFVHPDRELELEKLQNFLQLLPAPDCILFLDANERDLSERLRFRRDIPMGLPVERAGRFIAASRQTFDQILNYYSKSQRLIYCKNQDEAKNALSKRGGFRYNHQSE